MRVVAIDQKGNPVQIPGLALETEAARAEWEGGEKGISFGKPGDRKDIKIRIVVMIW